MVLIVCGMLVLLKLIYDKLQIKIRPKTFEKLDFIWQFTKYECPHNTDILMQVLFWLGENTTAQSCDEFEK